MRSVTVIGLIAGLFLCSAAHGCSEPEPQRGPPPPQPKKGNCAVEAKFRDPRNVALFPKTAGAFCLDPNGSDNGAGGELKGDFEKLCGTYDGECAIYQRFGAKQFVEARYVDGKGGTANIDVKLSKYGSPALAYGMFTKRTVGDSDPAHPDTAKGIAGGGAAALGIGNSYLWKGSYLAEIVLTDMNASRDQLQKQGDSLLPGLAAAFGKKLPGDSALPAVIGKLPTEHRLPMGLRYMPKNILDITGTGPGGRGYYKQGEQRWRMVAVLKDDTDQAKDVIKTIGKTKGSVPVKHFADRAIKVMLQFEDSPIAEWLVASKGNLVLGIGDEKLVLRTGMSPDERKQKTLSYDDKMTKLRTFLLPPKKD